MKYAVISDIHGNMFALNAVLEEIEKQKPDRILCLGDIAMAGPEPNKTINFVKTQDWTIIQGNTDYMISNFSDKIYEKVAENAPIMANALKNDIEQIEKINIEYLKNLPQSKVIIDENLRILLVHGSPRKIDENIFPNMPISEIEEIVGDVDADVVLCGHTHIPCGYQTDSKKTVVNVGSVGRPFTEKPDACYLILDIKNSQMQIEHYFVNYDREKAAKILSDRKFEGAKNLAEMLICPTSRHM